MGLRNEAPPASSARNEAPPATHTRSAPLRMDADEFRALGHRLVDDLAELLASIPRRPVTPGESPTPYIHYAAAQDPSTEWQILVRAAPATTVPITPPRNAAEATTGRPTS